MSNRVALVLGSVNDSPAKQRRDASRKFYARDSRNTNSWRLVSQTLSAAFRTNDFVRCFGIFGARLLHTTHTHACMHTYKQE